MPASQAKRAELVAVYGTGALVLLRELPAVEVLRRVLVQNYRITTDTTGREVIGAREAGTDGLPPGRTRLSSPYDTGTRWAAKGDELRWNGYKVHVTQTCDTPGPTPGGGGDSGGGDRPDIIAGVAATDATVPDTKMPEPIHAAPAARDLLCAGHYLGSGYPPAALVLDSLRRWGITLVTPLLADQSRQARAGAGYDRASFTIDFGTHRRGARRDRPVPGGTRSPSAAPTRSRSSSLPTLPRASAVHPLGLTDVRTSAHRATARGPPRPTRRTSNSEIRGLAGRYATRAGVEGTIRQAVAVTGTRRARYRGPPKTRLEHVFSATALNLIRLHAYWNGHPLDRTRNQPPDPPRTRPSGLIE